MQRLPKLIYSAIGALILTGTTQAADPIQKTTPYCGYIKSTRQEVEGRRAYMRLNCYSCHGSSAHGGSMGPSLVGKANSVDVVYEGDGHGMPGFKNNLCSKVKIDPATYTSNSDVANLKAYLLLLGSGEENKYPNNITNWWEDGIPTE